MVDRLERVAVKCAVVDLDGTIINGNSMHEMVKFMFKECLRSGDFATVSKLAFRLLLRRLRLVTHREMKYPIHSVAGEFMTYGDKRMERLTDILMRMLNPAVMKKLEQLKNDGYKIIIATAAPDIYMDALTGRLGADSYTATPIAGRLDEYIENRGEQKLMRIKEVASANGWDIDCVVTDHEDDLPLLTLPEVKRILVSPDEGLCDRLRELKLSFSVIK